MDTLLRQSRFNKTYIDYNPPLEGGNPEAIKAYMDKYKDRLAQAINRSTVPVITIRPGMGFSANTQEFLKNHFAAHIITEIETRLLATKYDAEEITDHLATAPDEQVIIINGLHNTTTEIEARLINAVEKHKDHLRFIISIYDTNVN